MNMISAKGVLVLILSLLSVNLCHAQEVGDFMGIKLGASFDLPECQRGSYTYKEFYEQSVRPCHLGQPYSTSKKIDVHGTFETKFIADPSRIPQGAAKYDPEILVIDGVVEGVSTYTTGFKHQESLYRALVEKYGKPTETKVTSAQNRMGATFEDRSATWKTSYGQVLFMGLLGSIDSGYIEVKTNKGLEYEARQLAEKEARKPKF